MRKRLLIGVVAAVAGTLALVAGSYASGEKSARPSARGVLPAGSCAPVYYGPRYGQGRGGPKYIIASDLPMQGANRPQTTQMVAAIKYILAGRKFKAGKYTIGYQACDDSTAETGKWNSAKCTDNGRSYADDRSVIGVIGTFNSGCAKLIIPILNRAPGGAVGMVSPSNTGVGLTVSGLGANPGEPDIYYPTHKRNYIRVVTRDDIQGPAGALLAKSLKIKKVFILEDKEVYGHGVSTTFETAAKKLGLTVTGREAWDPKASSYEPLATRIKQAGANGVYLGGIICNNGTKLVKDLRSVLGTGVKIIGPDGWTPFSSLISGAGSAAQGMYVTVPGAPPESLKGAGAKFVKAFKKTQGGKSLASYVAYAAQSAVVLLDAIKRSNGSRSSVTAQLFKTNVKNGIVGSFKIDKNGDTNLAGITAYIIKGNDGKAIKAFYPTKKLTGR